jgi:hypothetical protein
MQSTHNLSFLRQFSNLGHAFRERILDSQETDLLKNVFVRLDRDVQIE